MAADQTPADAYYGDDDANTDDELDLSFLDEDEEQK